MSTSIDDIRRVAALAKLTVDEDEAARLADELSAILGYVARVSHVSSTEEDARNPTPWRSDDPRPSTPELIHHAPRVADRLILAPHAFEDDA